MKTHKNTHEGDWLEELFKGEVAGTTLILDDEQCSYSLLNDVVGLERV